MRAESILTLFVTCRVAVGYWEPERQKVENPRNDQSTCDEYCKLLLPSYINWREHVTGTEYNGLDVVLRDTDSGYIKGLSVPGVHDTNSFISMFLGIPYAKPPVHEDAFKVGQHVPLTFSFTVTLTFSFTVLHTSSRSHCAFLWHYKC